MSSVDLNKRPDIPPHDPTSNISTEKNSSGSSKIVIGCITVAIVLVLVLIGIVIFLGHTVIDKITDIFSEEEEMRTIVTPDGEATVPKSAVSDFYDAVSASDPAAMSGLLAEYPSLAYLQEAIYPELDRVILHGTPEMVSVMLDSGVEIDDRFLYEPRVFVDYTYQYALENYFARRTKSGDGSDELLMVEYVIDHGAMLEYGYADDELEIKNAYGEGSGKLHQPNALFSAAQWICKDGELSQSDVEMIDYLVQTGIDLDTKNSQDESAAEYFRSSAEEQGISENAEFKKIEKALNK